MGGLYLYSAAKRCACLLSKSRNLPRCAIRCFSSKMYAVGIFYSTKFTVRPPRTTTIFLAARSLSASPSFEAPSA